MVRVGIRFNKMFMLEVTWWAHRALWHLMFSGVFERHPNLQFVLTETGTGWVPEKLRELDSFYDRMKNEEQCSEHKFGTRRPEPEKEAARQGRAARGGEEGRDVGGVRRPAGP